jgi:antitoxin PrlF
MALIVGTITAKSHTTVPGAVRRALGLKPGGKVGYVIDGDQVRLCRVAPEGDDTFAAFDEWSGENGRKAYAGS